MARQKTNDLEKVKDPVTKNADDLPQDKDKSDAPEQGSNVPPPEHETPPQVFNWIDKMDKVPMANVRGAGSTQEKRCTPAEIEAIINATVSLYGIQESTALTSISEMVHRGGSNASTPDSFTINIKCQEQNVIASVSKRDIYELVKRHANGKSMRNLAEGISEAVVRFGVLLVKKHPGLDRPGDLAKKVDNRLSYEKQPPLTPAERVGCASYAQWLPNLNEIVDSSRLKSLLAKDLELRKQGRVLPQPKAEGKGSESNKGIEKKGQKSRKGKKKGKN